MDVNANRQVEIPEQFLLTLAVYGNMGDGEIPKIMQVWAERECLRLGLSDKVRAEREERYAELKRRVQNLMGNDVVNRLEQIGGTLSRAMESNRKRV